MSFVAVFMLAGFAGWCVARLTRERRPPTEEDSPDTVRVFRPPLASARTYRPPSARAALTEERTEP